MNTVNKNKIPSQLTEEDIAKFLEKMKLIEEKQTLLGLNVKLGVVNSVTIPLQSTK